MPLIIANWKCNPLTLKEAKHLFNSVSKESKRIKGADAVICPPFIYLGMKGIDAGAQNCYFEQKGAFTGEISVDMLKDLGCKYVIIGHSERRKCFSESNELINKKLKAVLSAGLKPIFCVGETKEQKEEAENVLKNQLVLGLDSVSASKIGQIVFAYEPVWAIGTGNACSVEESQKMRISIMKIVSELYSQKIAKESIILYGGSVNSQNCRGYIKEAGFNGLLVGGASLNAEEFIKIIKNSI